MQKMNPEVKSKWIEALRSGKFKQGDGVLKQTDEFDETYTRHCCLGVLCDLAVEAGVSVAMQSPAQADYVSTWTFDENTESLPESVMKWAGITSSLGMLGEDEFYEYSHDGETAHYESLADMNDMGLSFEQIAEVIEKEF